MREDLEGLAEVFWDFISVPERIQEKETFEKIASKLAKNTKGVPYHTLLKKILESENLCMSRAVTQFMLVEPISYFVRAYIEAVKFPDQSHYISTLYELDGMPYVVDIEVYDYVDELIDIFMEEDFERAKEELLRVLKSLRGFRFYRYKFPFHHISDVFKKVTNAMNSLGFSEETISALNGSLHVCTSAGITARDLFIGSREEAEGSFDALFMVTLTFVMINRYMPPADRELAADLLKNSPPMKDQEARYSVLSTAISMEGEVMDKKAWKAIRGMTDFEEFIQIISFAKTDNPDVPIPIEGFEKELFELSKAVFPYITGFRITYEDESLDFSELDVRSYPNVWYLVPYLLAVNDREEVYRSFRTLKVEKKEDIFQATLYSFFPEDGPLLKPVLKKLLQQTNKKIRREFEEKVEALKEEP